MTTQIPINISLFRSPQCSTKSALDRNLNAKPNSRKPNIILNVFIHLPDLGKDFSILGKRANKVNGRANAIPNPNIPIDNWIAPPWDEMEPTNKDPRIGPVHEKETRTSVSDMKNTPIKPPIVLDFESIEFIQEDGIVNS